LQAPILSYDSLLEISPGKCEQGQRSRKRRFGPVLCFATFEFLRGAAFSVECGTSDAAMRKLRYRLF
jgi:hypothetical protein